MANQPPDDGSPPWDALRDFLDGNTDVKDYERKLHPHVVDLDADPVAPEGMRPWYHRKCGTRDLATSRFDLRRQEDTREREALPLALKLARIVAALAYQSANARVADAWLERPDLIPADAEQFERLIFMGTVFEDGNGIKWVTCLERGSGGWRREMALIFTVVQRGNGAVVCMPTEGSASLVDQAINFAWKLDINVLRGRR